MANFKNTASIPVELQPHADMHVEHLVQQDGMHTVPPALPTKLHRHATNNRQRAATNPAAAPQPRRWSASRHVPATGGAPSPSAAAVAATLEQRGTRHPAPPLQTPQNTTRHPSRLHRHVGVPVDYTHVNAPPTGVRVPVMLVPSFATVTAPEQPSADAHSQPPMPPPAARRSHSTDAQTQRTTCRRILAAAAVCQSPGAAPLQPQEQAAVATLLHDAPPTGDDEASEHLDGDGWTIGGDDDVLSLPDIATALCSQLEELQHTLGPPVAAWYESTVPPQTPPNVNANALYPHTPPPQGQHRATHRHPPGGRHPRGAAPQAQHPPPDQPGRSCAAAAAARIFAAGAHAHVCGAARLATCCSRAAVDQGMHMECPGL